MTPDPGPVFHNFMTPAPGPKEKRRILPESTPHFRSVTTSGVDPSGTLKNWVIGFILSITARSASALAIAFFRLLEPSHVYASTRVSNPVFPNPKPVFFQLPNPDIFKNLELLLH